MRFPTATTTTLDVSRDSSLLSVVRDDGVWVVSDHVSACYGAGESLLEAMCDYWNALKGLAALRDANCAPTLRRQVDEAVRLTERAEFDVLREGTTPPDTETGFAGTPPHLQPNGGSCTCSVVLRDGYRASRDRSRCPIHRTTP